MPRRAGHERMADAEPEQATAASGRALDRGKAGGATGGSVALQTAVTGPRLTSEAAFALFWVAFALFYLWSTADGQPRALPLLSLFGTRPQSTTQELRSQYERQIRQAAMQEERIAMPPGKPAPRCKPCSISFAPLRRSCRLRRRRASSLP